METVNLLINVSCPGEGCPMMLRAEWGQEEIKRLVKLIDKVRNLASDFSDFHCVECFDSGVSPILASDVPDDYDVYAIDDFLLLPESPDCAEVRVGCLVLRVMCDGVLWSWSDKYTDLVYESHVLTREALVELLTV